MHLQDADGKDVVPSINVTIEVREPAPTYTHSTHRIALGFQMVRFSAYGDYQITFLVDEKASKGEAHNGGYHHTAKGSSSSRWAADAAFLTPATSLRPISLTTSSCALDEAAAQNLVALVEDYGLSGGYGPLRLPEPKLSPIVEWYQGGPRRGGLVAYLCLNLHRAFRRDAGRVVHAAGQQRRSGAVPRQAPQPRGCSPGPGTGQTSASPSKCPGRGAGRR